MAIICRVCNHAHTSHRKDYCLDCGYSEKTRHIAAHVFVYPPPEPKSTPAPPFPESMGRIVTASCSKDGCTWEAVYVLPEEAPMFLHGVLEHLRLVHGLDLTHMGLQYH